MFMNKMVFSCNSDISKNAYMNWRTNETDIPNNLFVLAEGFSKAAQLLMEEIIEDNHDKKADCIIFPIIYSIDHSIELYLKAIIRAIETINKKHASNHTIHDIRSLLKTMISLIEKKEIRTKGLQRHIEPVKSYIDELYSFIKVDESKKGLKIDFARYPIDTDERPHFYICNLNNVVIDIENLMELNQKIHVCLESLFYKYQHELEEIL